MKGIRKWVCVLLLFLFIIEMIDIGAAENAELRSQWDADILNMQLGGVHINATDVRQAWQEISTKCLLRANIYLGKLDSASFDFNRESATGKDLIEAFLEAYSTYTYTQDPKTGVIWIHPRNIKYNDILSQRVNIEHPVYQIPVFNAVFMPLCGLLSPSIIPHPGSGSMRAGPSLNYVVNLSKGIYSVRDILNLCCVSNPTKAFEMFSADEAGYEGGVIILPVELRYNNPLAPPRATAVRFWESEVGKPTNGIPSATEVGAAMGHTNMKKRWAARCYLEAASINYRWSDIIKQSGGAENKVWAALGIEAATYRGMNDDQFLRYLASGFTTNMMQIKDPGLALISSLELAREKQGTNYLYLDTIVSQHKFTETEVASIKPDIYRLAHESPLVLDKLKAMKLDVPEFSPKALDELAETNLFTLVPAEKR